jgi:spore maturation protein CgeB
MRILISGHIYPDSFARNIAVAAEGMGHTVATVDPRPVHRRLGYVTSILSQYASKALPSIEKRRQRSLVRSAKMFQPDLILITHATFRPDVIREVRRESSARVAAWYPDSLANLGRQYLLESDLDAWFFKDPYMVEGFRAKLGLNTHYLPEACNPLWHRRLELSDADRRRYGCDLTSACNMYYYRARMLEIFGGYDLKIWGTGFPFWLRSPLRAHYPNVYVAELEKSKAFNAAKIVVNTMYLAEIEGVNCRLFEAAGCGGFQIADWKPGLAELFEPEREVVTFRSRDELREKVDYYLARPEERQAIADRGYARAHREHTYERRLARLFQTLGLPSGASIQEESAEECREAVGSCR